MFIMSGAAMAMVFLVNHYGEVTSAAYFAASQVWTYLQMPVMAVGASLSSMAGQNIGAGRWDRVGRIAWTGIIAGLVITTTMAGLIYAFEPFVMQLFLPIGSPALPVAQHINLIVMWSFILFSVTFPLSGVVRATGAVWVPLCILFVSMVLIRWPFALVLQPTLGADSIWWSFPLGTIVSAILTTAFYRFGNWRSMRMLSGFGGPPRGGPGAAEDPAPAPATR
jgi:Na+-driven multidrug efflux pump